MSYSLSTLLTRNLHEVFGENDTAGGSNGYRAARAMRRPTPVLISSSRGMAGSPPSIFFDKLP